MRLAKLWYRIRVKSQIAASRLRVYWLRLQGGRGIHPKCLFGPGVRIERPWLVSLGARCTLQGDVWLNVGSDGARLRVGDYTFIGRGSEIEVSTAVTIGKYCLIAPGVFITDHNHSSRLGTPMFRQPCIPGPVVIEEDVWIGANCVICAGVRIGEGAVVGAGAVVTRDVPPYTVVGGVPARPLRTRVGHSQPSALTAGAGMEREAAS